MIDDMAPPMAPMAEILEGETASPNMQTPQKNPEEKTTPGQEKPAEKVEDSKEPQPDGKNQGRKYIQTISPAQGERPKFSDPLWLGNMMTYNQDFSTSPLKTEEFQKRAENLH